MELTIEITARCINRCIHCSSDASPGSTGFLDETVIASCIASLEPAKVILSGGEPLLHPGIATIIDMIKDAGITLAVNTCGVLPSHQFPGNFNRVDEVYVSWHGETVDITRFDPPLQYMHPFQIVAMAKRIGIATWFNAVIFGDWQVIDIPRACFHAGVPVHLMQLIRHGRATGIDILPVPVQRDIATRIIDQLDPSRARERPPSFFCSHLEEVLPDDIDRLAAIHPGCKISHSLVDGKCRCREKRTLLPDGRLIGCVAGKGIDERFDVYKACRFETP